MQGQDLRLADKSGRLLLDSTAGEGDFERPEIDRSALRSLLLNSLAEGTVQWGHNLARVDRDDTSDHQFTLHFENGAQRVVTNAILIGADGAWSRVRPILTPARPVYTGVSFVELCISNVAEKHPTIATSVGNGTLFSYADSKGIIAQRNGDGRLRIYLAFREPEGTVMAGVGEDASADAKRAHLVAKFEGWADWLMDMIRWCDDDVFVQRAVTALPTGEIFKIF